MSLAQGARGQSWEGTPAVNRAGTAMGEQGPLLARDDGHRRRL